MFAEFVLNSGRREKVSSPGVALDPTRPPYPQLRDFMAQQLRQQHNNDNNDNVPLGLGFAHGLVSTFKHDLLIVQIIHG